MFDFMRAEDIFCSKLNQKTETLRREGTTFLRYTAWPLVPVCAGKIQFHFLGKGTNKVSTENYFWPIYVWTWLHDGKIYWGIESIVTKRLT